MTRLLLASTLSLVLSTASAVAATEDARAFATRPLADDILASITATASPFFPALRPMNDANALPLIQQFGQTSRIAVDNWWARTGDVLIANNQILQR